MNKKKIIIIINYIKYKRNTCYKDVNEQKIIQGLEEFKNLNIPIEYLLIDDGWQKYSNDDKLERFEPDEKKFPKGVDDVVKRAKKDYNIKHVGLWHTLQGILILKMYI